MTWDMMSLTLGAPESYRIAMAVNHLMVLGGGETLSTEKHHEDLYLLVSMLKMKTRQLSTHSHVMYLTYFDRNARTNTPKTTRKEVEVWEL